MEEAKIASISIYVNSLGQVILEQTEATDSDTFIFWINPSDYQEIKFILKAASEQIQNIYHRKLT